MNVIYYKNYFFLDPEPSHIQPEEHKLWTRQNKEIILLNIYVFKNKTIILDVCL